MDKILRILHLEDTKSDAEIVKREIVKSGMACEWCLTSSKSEFQEALKKFIPDIILSDHTLHSFTSVQALKMVREHGLNIPFILVTATVSEEFAVSMIKEGISDYILKDRLQRLPNAILSAIEKWKSRREKAEYLEEIIRREANLNAIIENSDVSIYSLDIDFRYITFNSLLKNTLKKIYNLDIKVGDKVFDFLKKLEPFEAREWENIYSEALSGKSLTFEKEFRIGDYHAYANFSINPIWEKNGIIGLSCFAHDTTAQRMAQEKLRQSEERYRNIIETAQEGIWIIDENDQTNFVNKKLCEILECAPDEIMGKRLYDFADSDAQVTVDREIELRKKGINQTLDFKLKTKHGKMVWTNLSTSSLLDSDGKYSGTLAMVTDITNKKLYQQSLEKSEANIRSIFENTHVAYILVDRHFAIVSFNQVASAIYEKALNKHLEKGNNLTDYFPASRKEYLEAQYHAVLKGKRIDYETNYTSMDDSLAWYSIQLLPVFDVGEEIMGMVVATTDITARKESELQREKITDDLIQRNKDLDQFTYIVSHNLRAPVANILGICNILHYPNITEEERLAIEEGISSSAKKMDDVIIDLNYILQVKHEINEKREVVVFSELVDDIQISIASVIEKEGVKIITDFKTVNELVTLRSYLYSIFYNLISNSIKYRQADVRPVVSIRSALSKNKLELQFKDNGIGIDLTKHGDKIFGLYKRFHTLETEGKGMGLYMVKSQVETLGGKINVTSSINHGTEFKINFDL